MNVLHVSENYIWGGNEQQLYLLITGLQSFGVNQSLFCFTGSPLIEKLEAVDIEIIAISNCKVFSRKYTRTLSNIISSHEINLMHLHTSASLTGYVITDIFYRLKVKAIFSKKAVSSSTSFLSKFKYNYSGIHSIICVSHFVKNHFKTLLNPKNQRKLAVVYDGVSETEENKNNPVTIRETLGLRKSTFIIGNIANHTKAKDLHVLVEIANYLINELKITDIHIVQIGNFTSRTENLKEKVNEYNLEEYISFLGFSENAFVYQKVFDVFLITSEREGGPTVVIEAFQHKTPVISTNVGLIDDFKNQEKSYLHAEVGDFKRLGDHVLKLKNNKKLEKQIIDEAYDLFQKNFTKSKFSQ